MSMLLRLSMITVSVLLASCGGGGSSDEGSSSSLGSIEGKAIDGYLISANVCLDLNDNYVCDLIEPNSKTEADGKFKIEASQQQIENANIVVEVVAGQTIDSNNPIAYGYSLSAPAGYHVVTPFTTLALRVQQSHPDLTIPQSIKIVKDLFKLSTDLGDDYIVANDTEAHEVAKKITRMAADALSTAKEKAASFGETITTERYRAVFSTILVEILRKSDRVLSLDIDSLPDIQVIGSEGLSALLSEYESLNRTEFISATDIFNEGAYFLLSSADFIEGDRGTERTEATFDSFSIQLDDKGLNGFSDFSFEDNTWVRDVRTGVSTLGVVLTNDGWRNPNNISFEKLNICRILSLEEVEKGDCFGLLSTITASKTDLGGVPIHSIISRELEWLYSSSFIDEQGKERLDDIKNLMDTKFNDGDEMYSLLLTRDSPKLIASCWTSYSDASANWDCEKLNLDTLDTLIAQSATIEIGSNKVKLFGKMSDASGDIIDANSGHQTGIWRSEELYSNRFIVTNIKNGSGDFYAFAEIDGIGVVKAEYVPKDTIEIDHYYSSGAFQSITSALTDHFPVTIFN